MLVNPQHGWVTVEIGDWSDRASYLTNVPIDALDAFINSYNHRQPATIKFDAEGWEYIVVIDDWETYIIEDLYRYSKNLLNSPSADPILTIVKVNKRELAKELVNDIQSHFYEWVNWRSDDGDTEELKEYEFIVRNKLRILKDLIERK